MLDEWEESGSYADDIIIIDIRQWSGSIVYKLSHASYIFPAKTDQKCECICDPAWENRAYVHKIHLFVLWYISLLLFKILKFSKLH